MNLALVLFTGSASKHTKKVSCTFGKGNKLYDAFSGWDESVEVFPPENFATQYNTEGTMQPSKELSARGLKKSFRVFFFFFFGRVRISQDDSKSYQNPTVFLVYTQRSI